MCLSSHPSYTCGHLGASLTACIRATSSTYGCGYTSSGGVYNVSTLCPSCTRGSAAVKGMRGVAGMTFQGMLSAIENAVGSRGCYRVSGIGGSTPPATRRGSSLQVGCSSSSPSSSCSSSSSGCSTPSLLQVQLACAAAGLVAAPKVVSATDGVPDLGWLGDFGCESSRSRDGDMHWHGYADVESPIA